jgi:hypothetical protein
MNIVLVSKGPSTREVPKSDDYKIAALNDAIILCEEVDYFFMHDTDNWNIIDKEQYKKVKNFIVPYYPQKPHPGGFSEDYGADVWIEPVKEINPNCNFHLVALGVHDMNRLQYPNETPHMGETYSVLQTAATWLGMFTDIQNLITCGIDPEGGYHPMFEYKYLGERAKQSSVWTPEMAKVTETKFHNIARQYNYSVHRMTDDGNVEVLV